MNTVIRSVLLLLFVSVLVLTGCSSKEPPPLTYKVVEDESKRKIWRRVTVELEDRTDQATLEKLADYLHEEFAQGYERIVLNYRIRGGEEGGGFWAQSDFEPKPHSVIYGVDKDQYERILKSGNPSGDIIGVWMSGWGSDHKIAIYGRGGKTYFQRTYDVGSSNTIEVILTKAPRGIQVQDAEGSDFGEFMLINAAGELECWSENGNYYTAPVF